MTLKNLFLLGLFLNPSKESLHPTSFLDSSSTGYNFVSACKISIKAKKGKSFYSEKPTGDMTSSETFMLGFELFGLVCIWFVSKQGLIKRDVQAILLLNILCNAVGTDDWSAFVSKWVSLFVVLTLRRATCDNKALVRKPAPLLVALSC